MAGKRRGTFKAGVAVIRSMTDTCDTITERCACPAKARQHPHLFHITDFKTFSSLYGSAKGDNVRTKRNAPCPTLIDTDKDSKCYSTDEDKHLQRQHCKTPSPVGYQPL